MRRPIHPTSRWTRNGSSKIPSRDLVNTGMITEEERGRIVSRYLIDIPYSYPVPTVGRDRALEVVNSHGWSRKVYISRGRFGAWKYEVGNMDHSFMQGVEIAKRILTGASRENHQWKAINKEILSCLVRVCLWLKKRRLVYGHGEPCRGHSF